MLTKLYNHSLQTELFDILIQINKEKDKQLIELDNDELKIQYNKSENEIILFIYKNEKQMISDYNNIIYLSKACKSL